MSFPKIIGIGSPLVDVLSNVSEEFLSTEIDGAKGGMEMIDNDQLTSILDKLDNKELATGGSAGNTILGLLKLGAPASLLGKIGSDQRGNFYKNTFANAGADTSTFKICEDTPTGTCVSLVTPDAERTMRPFLGAAMGFSPADVSVEELEKFDHAHIEGYVLFNPELAANVLAATKEAKLTVSLDLASFEVVGANKAILPGILRNHVDMVFANEDEAKAFCDSEDPQVALDALSELCQTAVVKLGPDGAWIRHMDETVFVDAETVEAIDSTGAGDIWASGFIHSMLKGHSPTVAGQIAAKCGAEVVQIMGANIPDSTWTKINEFAKSFKLENK